jgi:hypothetical protein
MQRIAVYKYEYWADQESGDSVAWAVDMTVHSFELTDSLAKAVLLSSDGTARFALPEYKYL